MEELLKSWGARVPELGVLVVVVWMFLKFMKEMRTEFSEAMKQLHSDHMTARDTTHEVIERNTEALLSNSKALAIIEESISKCNKQ